MTAAAPSIPRVDIQNALNIISQRDERRADQLYNALSQAMDAGDTPAIQTMIDRILAEGRTIEKQAAKVVHRNASRRSWDVRNVPIDVDDVQPVGVVLRWMVGVIFIAYSIVTTAIIIGKLTRPLITADLDVFGVALIPWSILIGAAFGIAVTVGEWATVDKVPRLNWALIGILDAPFSAWQTYVWIMVCVVAFHPEPATWSYFLVGAFSLIWGVATAKFGEKLLVGKKKGRA